MVNVLQQALAENDEDAATKGFELFDTLVLLVCLPCICISVLIVNQITWLTVCKQL